MARNILISGILLALFGVVGTGIVAFVFQGTAERIAANEEAMMLASLRDILADDMYDNDILEEAITLSDELLGGVELRAYRAWLGDEPMAVVFSVIAPGGYSGPIRLLVGVSADGTVTGVRVVSHRETPGLGDDIEIQRSDWILGFDDRSLANLPFNEWAVRRDGGVFDQFTGATISPRAVVTAVRDALIYYESNRDDVFRRTPPEAQETDSE